MCGFVGIFDLQGQRDIDRGLLDRMNESQHRRGPDGGGLHLEPGLGLGHRRLAIIDVASGQQPLYNEDGSIVVVFNGEIYNFQELITELTALGHRFRTRSDTEVIVHAWIAWGEACLDRFRGMFAFALWDRHREILFIARDRLGVKPLFYAITDSGHLIFGSELKSLRSTGLLRETLDPFAVEDYFTLGYIPEPRTIFRGCNKLPPAHRLTLRRGQPMPNSIEYWKPRFSLDAGIGAAEASEELIRRLRESVRLRMISEVPLGAFLSGGVDSSAVVAAMALESNTPVTTCSIAFDDPSYDESVYALQVADRYRTRHLVDRVKSDDFSLIDALVDVYDEPFADSSALPTYRVCELARKHVTVALSGDGGDESFGGYRRYRMQLAEENRKSALPLGLRRPLFGGLAALLGATGAVRSRNFFESVARDGVEGYLHEMSIVRGDLRARLFSPSLLRELGGYTTLEVFRHHAARAETDDPLALVQFLDLQTYLVGDINTKVDRASMAHGLEVREPLMDHPLVEWLGSLPSALKIRGNEGKWLLKHALEPLLPQEVLYRPKMGFAVPLASWFRGPLREKVRGALLGPRLASTGYFEERTLRSIVQEHLDGRADRSAVIWSLLMFDGFLATVSH